MVLQGAMHGLCIFYSCIHPVFIPLTSLKPSSHPLFPSATLYNYSNYHDPGNNVQAMHVHLLATDCGSPQWRSSRPFKTAITYILRLSAQLQLRPLRQLWSTSDGPTHVIWPPRDLTWSQLRSQMWLRCRPEPVPGTLAAEWEGIKFI